GDRRLADERIHRGFGRLHGEIVGTDPAESAAPAERRALPPPDGDAAYGGVDERRRGDRIIAWSQRRRHIEKDLERRLAGRIFVQNIEHRLARRENLLAIARVI